MKNAKKLLALFTALSMTFSLAACGGGGGGAASSGGGAAASSGGSAPAGGTVKIAYIPKERNESFWQAVEAGAQQAATDLGAELIMYGDAAGANTAANQSTYVETATELGVNAIAFAALLPFKLHRLLGLPWLALTLTQVKKPVTGSSIRLTLPLWLKSCWMTW